MFTLSAEGLRSFSAMRAPRSADNPVCVLSSAVGAALFPKSKSLHHSELGVCQNGTAMKHKIITASATAASATRAKFSGR